MMLSVFSCTCWASVCLLWKKISIQLLYPFLVGLFVRFFLFVFMFLLLSCMNSLYIVLLDISPFSSVTQSCLTLCNPMDCSTEGFPVHHQLLEFGQTHVHRVSDAIQPSHPLLLLPSVFPSIKVFYSESILCIRQPKYWSFSFSISPSSEYSGLISFRIDWFDLAVQGTLTCLLQHHSSEASVISPLSDTQFANFSFHSMDSLFIFGGSLYCAEAFYIDVFPLIYFCPYSFAFDEDSKNHHQHLCQEVYHLSFLLGVLWCYVLLSSILTI